MDRAFSLVDVFADAPLTGNPLAVVCDAQGLDEGQMQQIARWLNLSETTFLLPPDDPSADYKVRIFTLERELPFAGHPTLGTAHVWLEAGGVPKSAGKIVQECGIGLVDVAQDGDRLAFAAPPLVKTGPLDEAELANICMILNLNREDITDHQWLDNGPGWVGVMLADADAVRAVKPLGSWPDRAEIGIVGPQKIGTVGRESGGAATDWEVRAIFSNQFGTLIEDPVTGSLNASVAQWLYASGRATGPYVAAQGSCIGRAGRVYASRDDKGQVWIAGKCQTLFKGASHLS